MKAVRWMMIGILLLMSVGVATADHHGKDPELLKELEAFGDELTKHMLAEDMDAMFAMYLDDAISMPNGSPPHAR